MALKIFMTGDYVINTEFGKYEADTIEIVEPTRVWLTHGSTHVPLLFIEPVPLTADILLKNNFVEVSGHFPYPTYEYVPADGEKFVVRVAFPNGSKATKRTKPFVEVDAKWCWHTSECEFVHSLQQVLRICGIEKEITI